MTSITALVCEISEKILFIPFLFLLAGSVILSIKTRFVQIRAIPLMCKLFFKNIFKKETDDPHAVSASRALFTAMATSIGVGAMIAPIIAIGFGGPGALLGFMLATFFGGASMFTEVTLSVKHRKRADDGRILGGPMQYIKDLISARAATIYAVLCFILIASWESNQSNTLASLLTPYHIPSYVTGILIAGITLFCLIGGIKRIGNIAAKLVPTMFLLYSGAGIWILIQNGQKLPGVIKVIFQSALSPNALAGAAVGTGIYKALRWGLAKGFYSNEAGVGTATIPHSKAKTEHAFNQGILAIVSVYTNGFLCLLSGLMVLVTGVCQKPGAVYNINLLSKALAIHFPLIGPFILLFCATLFSFTTILGNGYNGGQCFLYATGNKFLSFYYALIAIIIFAGAVSEIKLVWALSDFFMIPVALINIVSLITISFRRAPCELVESRTR